MSAIAGILFFGSAQSNRSRVEKITRPAPGNRVDALALWVGGGIVLGHAAASVTPESLREQQPLVASVSGCVITFDGRLDNREELHSALADKASLVEQGTDPAYVLAAYLRWGNDLPNHLRGDFAFAIWNPHTRQLLLARDPLGQRTLFYSLTGDGIVFASTLEQLLQDPNIPRDLDEETLPLYFYGYGGLRQRTAYRAIKSLPNGCRLVISEQQPRIERYWSWQEEPPAPRAVTPQDIDEFRFLLADAVRCRLRSHAPIGIFLSGGLDSNAIACMAGHLHEQGGAPRLRAYSFVFDRLTECDERRYIEATVARYGLEYMPVLADECFPLSRLDEWSAMASESSFNPTDSMFFAALERARQDGLRAMLMGHGGDALFDGSPRYFADLLLQGRWRYLHRQVRAYSQATRRPYLIGLVGNAVTPLMPLWIRRLIEFRRFPRITPFVPPHFRKRGFGALPMLYRGRNAWWYLLRDALTSGEPPQEAHLDRLTRRFGIELRQPLLDVRLIQFVLRLPPDASYSDGARRQLVRQGLRDILPPVVRDRSDKTVFSSLFDYGLRVAHRRFVEALLQDGELARRGYVVADQWEHAIKEYLRGTRPLYWTYWRGLGLEIWLRIQTGRLPSPE